MKKSILFIFLTVFIPSYVYAQSPDRRGEAWGGDTYQGTTANVVIPMEMRQRNSTGIDGAGICVVASMVTAGRYQGLSEEVEKLWNQARRETGGHSPSKWSRLVNNTTPGLRYGSYLGKDDRVLHRLSELGYPVGGTMNTGRLYGYRPIAHMVTVVHYDRDKNVAAIVDNNKPEITSWMPATEYYRRWQGGMGGGWLLFWENPPPRPRGSFNTHLMGVVVGGLFGSVIWCVIYRRVQFNDA